MGLWHADPCAPHIVYITRHTHAQDASRARDKLLVTEHAQAVNLSMGYCALLQALDIISSMKLSGNFTFAEWQRRLLAAGSLEASVTMAVACSEC